MAIILLKFFTINSWRSIDDDIKQEYIFKEISDIKYGILLMQEWVVCRRNVLIHGLQNSMP